jgi:hypothetical protein
VEIRKKPPIFLIMPKASNAVGQLKEISESSKISLAQIPSSSPSIVADAKPLLKLNPKKVDGTQFFPGGGEKIDLKHLLSFFLFLTVLRLILVHKLFSNNPFF